MDSITKERMKVWDRRLEGGLDGGDVGDVLNDWKMDVSRYEEKIDKLVVQLAKTKDLVKSREKEIEALAPRDDFLSALEEAGVDNWEGYSEAWRILEEQTGV